MCGCASGLAMLILFLSMSKVEYKSNRKQYEFDFSTKQEALEKAGYRCEWCEAQDSRTNRLEVDHAIAIWFARENPALTVEVIKSIANATVLCHECHADKHLQESRRYYADLAPTVLAKYLENIIDPHLDDWRDKLKQVHLERND